ncbi:DKNYY domain-containing protein [uncultured Muribaculum sp.]|uniref:DKNYY domain-containing protein n=2 Tax=uncultured Muribaculum sp. TaxID=1918613 RepID=UPI0025D7D653|nr:DKNYY domain-containing protein [uncultured Muribaculum sp.]
MLKSASLLLATIFMATGLTLTAQCPDHRPHCGRAYECPEDGHRHCGRHDRCRYIVSNDKVYFNGHLVKDASAMTFKTLADGYAADAWNVYFDGRKIDGASVNSFQYLGDGYAKDNWNAYYLGAKIDGASVNSFETLGDGYAHDNWNTYYCGNRIAD